MLSGRGLPLIPPFPGPAALLQVLVPVLPLGGCPGGHVIALLPVLCPLAADDTGQSASYYPISVEEYTYGDFDELRINKTYQLSLSDDPSLIPTEDFTRNGRRYYLLDMTRKDEVGVDILHFTSPKVRVLPLSSMLLGMRDTSASDRLG